MDVFDLDHRVVNEYGNFARSFTKDSLDERATASRPEPIIQLNPHFQPGASISELVEGGLLHAGSAKFFQQSGIQNGQAGPPMRLGSPSSSSVSSNFFHQLCTDRCRSRAPSFPSPSQPEIQSHDRSARPVGESGYRNIANTKGDLANV